MLRTFEMHQPHSVEEAAALLGSYGMDASLYAGGTELLMLMKEGLVHYPHLIDLKAIPGLDQIEVVGDDNYLSLGPMVTHRQLERSRVLRAVAPTFAETERLVANPRVRAAGTLGGNLCFGEPHSDPATLLVCLEASLELTSSSGSRRIPIDEFLVGLFETARKDDEILTNIRVPLRKGDTSIGYEKITFHERPSATAAARLSFDSGKIADVKIAIGSVGPRPLRVGSAETYLSGKLPEHSEVQRAARMAAEQSDPVDDLYGSADFKRHLVEVTVKNALSKAVSRREDHTND